MPLQDQLNLILQIDHLADQTAEQEVPAELPVPSDKSGLALGLTTLIAQSVNADLCLLALPDEVHPRTLSIRAVIDRKNLLEALDKGIISTLLTDCLDQESGWLVRELDLNGTRLNLALFSLKQGDAPLGVMLVARQGQPLSEEEHALLQIARTQIDNVLRYANLTHRLQHETLALRTVLKIDRIRDSSSGLDDLLDRSLSELCRVIPAGVGFLMLYNRSGERLELRASTDQGFLARPEVLERLYIASDEAIRSGAIVHKTYPADVVHPADERHPAGQIQAILGVPLILNTRIIGVLGVLNPTGREDFSFSEHQLLHAVASQMDTAIFEQIQTQRLRETFGRSVDPHVMDQLLQIDDRDLLKGEREMGACGSSTPRAQRRKGGNFGPVFGYPQFYQLLKQGRCDPAPDPAQRTPGSHGAGHYGASRHPG